MTPKPPTTARRAPAAIGLAAAGALAASCSAPLVGAGYAPGIAQGRVDPSATQVEARSPQTLPISHRPAHVLRARIESVTEQSIEVATTITSGDPIVTTATSYYFDLTDDRGHRASEPEIVSESPPSNDPRSQTFQYDARVVDRELTNSRGDVVAQSAHYERRTGVAVENYWTRTQRLRFDRAALLTNGASVLRLDARDLNLAFRLEWRDTGGGGGAPGYAPGPSDYRGGYPGAAPQGWRYR